MYCVFNKLFFIIAVIWTFSPALYKPLSVYTNASNSCLTSLPPTPLSDKSKLGPDKSRILKSITLLTGGLPTLVVFDNCNFLSIASALIAIASLPSISSNTPLEKETNPSSPV